MQFDTAILTDEGVRLLTTASLDDRLVLTKFLFTANPFEPSPDLTTLTNTWGDGHVETQRTEGGVIHVDASASNRLTSGRAYGFGIWGYLSSEGAETGERLLLSAKAISPVVEVTLASGAWTIFRIHVAIQFAPASADAIIVEPSYNGFVSIDAFNRLEASVDALEDRVVYIDAFNRLEAAVDAIKDRVVTTHALGDERTGDDQLVLGNKTFQSDVFEWYTHAGNSGDRSTICATKDRIYFKSDNIIAQGYTRASVRMDLSYNEDTPTSNYIDLTVKQYADTNSGDSGYKSLMITNRGVFGYASSDTSEAGSLRFQIGRKPTEDGDYSHRFVGHVVLDSLDAVQMRPDGIPSLAPRINLLVSKEDAKIRVKGCGTTLYIEPAASNNRQTGLLAKTSAEVLQIERSAKPGIIGWCSHYVELDQNPRVYSYVLILRYADGRFVDPIDLEKKTRIETNIIEYDVFGSLDIDSPDGVSYTTLSGILKIIEEDYHGFRACFRNYAWKRSDDGATGYITVHEVNEMLRESSNTSKELRELYA